MIDGYNLLFASRRGRIDRRELAKERERLIQLILHYCRLCGKRAIVVFDHTKGPPVYGEPIRRNLGEMEYRFTPDDTTADEEIVVMLEQTKDRTAYTVVSSDRAITGAAEKRRIKSINSKEFADDLARVLKGDENRTAERLLSKEEVDYWMREFGMKE
ncbi:MAG: NYN domain-containing protein [Planctomycetota bacterium]